MTLKLFAYAKINLFLDVTGRREDGYHDIRSLMQTVDLHDTVTISVSEDGPLGITLECDTFGVPTNEKNLAYRAARAFYDAFGEESEKGTHIKLEKRIPMEAGLAGGSTDAAAVLVGLNRIFGEPFSTEKLCAIGKKLGADIPFCIVGGTVTVEGIGERLTPLGDLPQISTVVAKKGSGVSTPEGYRALDEMFDGFTGEYRGGTVPKERYDALLSAIEGKDPSAISAHLYNVFEATVLPHHREAAELKAFFQRNGALAALMSGSGPSVFAFFADPVTAHRAAERLNEGQAQPIAFVTAPVSRSACGVPVRSER